MLSEYPRTASCGILGCMHSLRIICNRNQQNDLNRTGRL
jgi:hypothetical protein